MLWAVLGAAIVGAIGVGALDPATREAGIGAVIGASVIDDEGLWRVVDPRRFASGEGLARLALPLPAGGAAVEHAEAEQPRQTPEAGDAQPLADLAEAPAEAEDDATALPRIAESLAQTVVAAGEPRATFEAEPERVPGSNPEPETVTEVAPEAVTEVAPEAVTEVAPEAVTEVAPEAVTEAVTEPAPVARIVEPRLAQAPLPPPPAPRPAPPVDPSAARIIPLPQLPEPRHVAVARAVPPPDGFATPAAATGIAARQSAGGATWTRHARPFEAGDARPRIALVVTDLGLSQGLTDHAIHYLPGAVTLAFNPFADNLPKWVDQARRAGHEVLINLPPEAAGGAPEPQGLVLQVGAGQAGAEAAGRLEWALNRSSGHVGVASFLGPSGNDQVLRPVLTVLRDRGFIFVGRQSGTRTPSARIAQELGVPYAAIDRQIDADPAREAIEQRLAELERAARENGAVVAMLRPHATTFERLAIWHTSLEAKGIALAPITAVLNRQRNR